MSPISSNPPNSSFIESSPNSFTTGNPVLSDHNFKVKRGPTSCNAAFSVDLKVYLDAHESDYRYRFIGNKPATPKEQGILLVIISLVMQCDHLSAFDLGHGGNIVWNILPTVCPNPITKLFKTNSGK